MKVIGKEIAELSTKNRPQALKAGSKTKWGRNDPCPCGSGKKFKKCCLKKYISVNLTRSKKSLPHTVKFS